MSEIILEVGMHNGKHTKRLLQEHRGKLYGFEPVPYLQEKLYDRYLMNPRVEINNYAVGDKDVRSVSFNISKPDGIHDYGCSSLYEFAENINEKWPGRRDFEKKETVKVRCVRLDSFLNALPVKPTKINYLWCDAQGNDWNVLKGLGEYLNIVEKGKVEAAYKVSLYDADNDAKDIAFWLNERGFKTTISPDKVNKECDVHFERIK